MSHLRAPGTLSCARNDLSKIVPYKVFLEKKICNSKTWHGSEKVSTCEMLSLHRAIRQYQSREAPMNFKKLEFFHSERDREKSATNNHCARFSSLSDIE